MCCVGLTLSSSDAREAADKPLGSVTHKGCNALGSLSLSCAQSLSDLLRLLEVTETQDWVAS